MKKKERIFRTVMSFAIIFLISFLVARFPLRLDLTSGHFFTLASFSREILSDLDSVVTVTWYRSSGLEQESPAIRYIDYMLEEYRLASRGLFSYTLIDPSVNNVQMNTQLSSIGILPRQSEIQQKDGKVIKDIYSGILVEYNGGHRVVPFLLDSAKLEYTLDRILLDLQNPEPEAQKKNIIQLIYGRTIGKDEYQYIQPWLSLSGYETRKILLPVTRLDPEESLLVLGSSLMDSLTVSSIDSFLAAGGNAAFFVSGNTVNTASNWTVTAKKNDPLIDLLRVYGISVESSLVLDKSNYRIIMPSLDNTKVTNINYPFWITVPRSSMVLANRVFSGISSLQFFWPSPLVLLPVPGRKVQGLAFSSASSIDMFEPYNTNPFGNQLDLFFRNKSAATHCLVAASTARGRILVAGDEYLPSSLVEYTNSDTNLDFLVNCAEWISGKDRLLDLKNRTQMQAISPENSGQVSARLEAGRLVYLLVLPSLVCLCVLFMYIRRKRYL